jgi:hypothetical protein
VDEAVEHEVFFVFEVFLAGAAGVFTAGVLREKSICPSEENSFLKCSP